jgi:asparagine synthase (glutamine-hydrolysing)
MCGICGVIRRDGPSSAETVGRMAETLAHRGPDGGGVRAEGAAAIGHRRLAIIDLSDAAAQPIANEDGSLWLTFNGEIYNFRTLRERLEPQHRFRSRSDGEVILHLYEEHGDDCVRALEGMFAFALWDSHRQRLLLARDRTGKKPLFYHDGPRLLAFASEVKALLACEDVPREIDPTALPAYLTFGYVPTPRTFYRSITALPPGHVLVVTGSGIEGPRAYWTPRFRCGEAHGARSAMERLRELLRAATRRRLVADVPLGVFLSGGLDSSTVVAFMAEGGAGRTRTFSIGFADGGAFDERDFARLTARHFGTDHTEFVVEPRSLDLIDRLVWHHDGPFGDASAVPTFLLAELTRSQVTVALNGDGGDEVFAGYPRLYAGALSERMPRAAFSALGAILGALPQPKDHSHPLAFLKRLSEVGRLPLADRYLRWNAFFPSGLVELVQPDLVPYCERESLLASFLTALKGDESTLARLMQLNFTTYLPDDLLVKMDRMSMAHGLETRSPFLDTEVVEFGASLADRYRVRWGRGKWLLREAMRGILPGRILARRKMGFGAPLGVWFRNDLRTLVRERLLESSSPIYEFVRAGAVESLIQRHMGSMTDLSPQIWALLTLESWLRQERAVVPSVQAISQNWERTSL